MLAGGRARKTKLVNLDEARSMIYDTALSERAHAACLRSPYVRQ